MIQDTNPVFTIPEDYYQEYIDRSSYGEYLDTPSATRIYLHIAISWSHFCHFMVHIDPADDVAYFRLPYNEHWRRTCIQPPMDQADAFRPMQYGFIKFYLHGRALKVFKLPFVSSELVRDGQGDITAIHIGVRWRRIL